MFKLHFAETQDWRSANVPFAAIKNPDKIIGGKDVVEIY